MARALGVSWNDAKKGSRRLALATATMVALAFAPAAREMPRAMGELVSVIVRELPGSGDAPETAVENLGGDVERHIGIIDGFVARIPQGEVARLEDAAGVHSVTRDYPIHMQHTENGFDPSTDPGSMYRTTQLSGANQLWAKGVTGAGVDVALIDTGVVPVNGLTYPGKVINGPDLSFESQFDESRYLDTYGHGTHMAGIIAGRDDEVSSLGQSNGASLQVVDGYDEKDRKTLIENGKLAKVVKRDGQYLEVKAGYATTFRFDAGIPSDAAITGAKLVMDHLEEVDFLGSVELGATTGNVRDLTQPLLGTTTLPLNLSGSKTVSFSLDVSAYADSPEMANALVLRVRNKSLNGKLAKVDSVSLQVQYQVPQNHHQFVGMAPDARIVNVKVANAGGVTDVSQVLAAIDWVVQHRNDDGMNIRVLNLSFGTNGVQDYRLDPLTYAAEVAWRRGIVVVVAAGNAGYGSAKLNNPAYDPFVLAVGGLDTKGTRDMGDDVVPAWSSTGDGARNPDFVAPGKSIVSLRNPGSYVDQHHPEGLVADRFFRGSGTSQAAAVTSGAVALLLQHRPSLTPDQVKAILTSSATPLPNADPTAQGAGELDLRAAFRTPAPVDATQTHEPATGTGSLHEARGSAIVADSDGTELSGEQTIFGDPWDGRTWSAQSFEGRTWSGGDWMGRTWSGSDWSGSSWAGRTWSGRTWSGRTWSGRTWSDDTWSGRTWSGRTWSEGTWSGRTWSGRTWSDDTWSGRTWSGVSWG